MPGGAGWSLTGVITLLEDRPMLGDCAVCTGDDPRAGKAEDTPVAGFCCREEPVFIGAGPGDRALETVAGLAPAFLHCWALAAAVIGLLGVDSGVIAL